MYVILLDDYGTPKWYLNGFVVASSEIGIKKLLAANPSLDVIYNIDEDSNIVPIGSHSAPAELLW
jgi:hypothetical protein